MNLRHETFIREMIAHGNRRQAYLVAYPASSAAAAYNNACRLLAIPNIRNRISAALKSAEQKALSQLHDTYDEQLADTYEKRLLLAGIIKSALQQAPSETYIPQTATKLHSGETISVTPVQKRNKRETLSQPPTVSQILRAIVLDTKLEYGWKRKI